jgi:UDP-GlcNAc3NAcA epimerase
MKKIVTVIGARPQFIKAAAVSHAISEAGGFKEVIVHTGQHFDHNMSKVFFDQMGIPKPAYNLDIHSLSHGAMTGGMLRGVEEVLIKERPDWLMVYGDTNSTLAGALAAVKLGIPVAHVEAGLRSFNMAMPEEINRILTDRISSMLFCPTLTAMQNLVKEGFEGFQSSMVLTGDVMYDAMLFFREKATSPERVKLPKHFVIATVHRAENTDDPDRLQNIIEAINEMANHQAVVFPVHPRTAKLMSSQEISALSPRVIRTEPLGYLEMLYLLERCSMVLTDSGGLQKEAYFFGKPCITVRDETEWTELIAPGYNRLCGSDKEKILAAFDDFKTARIEFREGLYGTGNAGSTIVQALGE